MRSEFKGSIRVSEDGAIKFFHKEELNKFLSSHPGEAFIFHVKKNRTNQQNRYFWLVLTMIGDEIGMHKDEVKEIMAFRYLRFETANEKTGEIYERVKSTKELSKLEFISFLDNVIMFASTELGMRIPSPGEAIKMDLDGEV